jgi:hypothetical protein
VVLKEVIILSYPYSYLLNGDFVLVSNEAEREEWLQTVLGYLKEANTFQLPAASFPEPPL